MKLSHYCIAIVLLAILFFVGCVEIPNLLIGTWSRTYTAPDPNDENVTVTLTDVFIFNSDGTYSFAQNEVVIYDDIYTYTESQFTITVAAGLGFAYNYTVSGDTLCITVVGGPDTETCYTKQ